MSEMQQKMETRLSGSRFRWLNEMLYTNHSDEAFAEFKKDPQLFEQNLAKKPKNRVIADFGCGEAQLAETLGKVHKVHSFDLVAKNERVVACDISHVPLEKESVDIVVFCLSLMGTNFLDFIREAHRVLKMGGRMMVAEIESRITDPDKFTSEISRFHFKTISIDERNKFFVLFEFEKGKGAPPKFNTENTEDILKPCLYKKR
eukprot:gene17475-20850_t